MPPNYTEYTFRDCLWTQYHKMSPMRGNDCPYSFIYVQALAGVAHEVVRNAIGIEVNAPDRYDRDSTAYICNEERTPPDYLFNFSSTLPVLIIRYDAVPYYINRIWPCIKWTKEET